MSKFRVIEIQCDEYKDCGETPCILVDIILRNLERGDEVRCTSGTIVWREWSEQSPENHVPDKVRGEDEPSEGQALGSERDSGEMPDTYSIIAIERVPCGVELTILDENKGNTSAKLVGCKAKLRVIDPEPSGQSEEVERSEGS